MKRGTNLEQDAYLGTFEASPGVSLYAGFAEHLRGGIEQGVFAAGEPLPALRRMSEISGVNYYSVQLATEALLAENRVCKVRGKGMFVRAEVPSCGVIGLLLVGRAITMYQSTLANQVAAQLADMGYETITILDACSDEERFRAPELLTRLIAGGRLQAVIGITVPLEARGWFDRLPLPLAFGDSSANSFAPLRELLESGRFQRPLLIFPDHQPPAQFPEEIRKLHRSFAENLRNDGIDVERLPHALIGDPETCGGLFPAQTKKILDAAFAASERPDLLFVYPDEALPGVIAAVYEAGIRVPGDLTVVGHRNLEFPVYAPFPVTFVEVSVAESARKLIDDLNLKPIPNQTPKNQQGE